MDERVRRAVALKGKIDAHTAALLRVNIGRDQIIRSAYWTMITGRPSFLLGPFGVNKTATLRDFARGIQGARFYDVLIPNVSAPEQILVERTRIKIQDVEGGQEIEFEDYLGRAADTHILFCDELFKVRDPEVLQAMLDLAEGGEVRHEGATHQTPLLAFLGASNEIPTDPELGASWSRMTVRVNVLPLDRAGKKAMTLARLGRYRSEVKGVEALKDPLTLADVEVLRAAWPFVVISDTLIDTALDILESLAAREDQDFSFAWSDDRRWGRAADLMMAEAMLNGRGQVTTADLWVLEHLWWDRVEHLPALKATLAPYIRTPLTDAREELNALLAPDGAVQAVVSKGNVTRVTAAVGACDAAIKSIIEHARKDAAYVAQVIPMLREIASAKGSVVGKMTGTPAQNQADLFLAEIRRDLTAEERGYLDGDDESAAA